MVVLKDVEKAFDKIQLPFIIKSLTKHRRNVSQLNKGYNDKIIANILGRLKTLKPGTRQSYSI